MLILFRDVQDTAMETSDTAIPDYAGVRHTYNCLGRALVEFFKFSTTIIANYTPRNETGFPPAMNTIPCHLLRKFPREAVGASSMELLKARLFGALSILL